MQIEKDASHQIWVAYSSHCLQTTSKHCVTKYHEDYKAWYNVTMYRPGKELVLADILSRAFLQQNKDDKSLQQCGHMSGRMATNGASNKWKRHITKAKEDNPGRIAWIWKARIESVLPTQRCIVNRWCPHTERSASCCPHQHMKQYKVTTFSIYGYRTPPVRWLRMSANIKGVTRGMPEVLLQTMRSICPYFVPDLHGDKWEQTLLNVEAKPSLSLLTTMVDFGKSTNYMQPQQLFTNWRHSLHSTVSMPFSSVTMDHNSQLRNLQPLPPNEESSILHEAQDTINQTVWWKLQRRLSYTLQKATQIFMQLCYSSDTSPNTLKHYGRTQRGQVVVSSVFYRNV